MASGKEEHIRLANNEIFGNGNLGVVDEIFASDYIAHAGGGDFKGHKFIKQFAGQLRAAMPDIRVLDVAFLNRSGDTVTWQRTLGGTHEAAMMGIPSSGKNVEWRDIVVSRFDGRKIAEEWVVSELAGQLLSKLA